MANDNIMRFDVLPEGVDSTEAVTPVARSAGLAIEKSPLNTSGGRIPGTSPSDWADPKDAPAGRISTAYARGNGSNGVGLGSPFPGQGA